jgi:hypothetical protein
VENPVNEKLSAIAGFDKVASGSYISSCAPLASKPSRIS